jgi:ribosomal protein L7/L12
MGIFDFFRKKTDVEEYYEKMEKEKENNKNNKYSGYTEISKNTVKDQQHIFEADNTDEINTVLRGNQNKIEKIKRIHEITNMNLKDAKKLVEDSEKDETFLYKAQDLDNIKEDKNLLLEDLLLSNISKIEKIKRVREMTGLGLKEAKELVEKHEK